MSKPNGEWKAPEVEVGRMVAWSPEPGSRDRFPAIVSRIDRGTMLVLRIFLDNGRLATRTGVRHASEPGLTPEKLGEAGIWDFLPSERSLEARVAALEEKLAAMESFGPKPGGKKAT